MCSLQMRHFEHKLFHTHVHIMFAEIVKNIWIQQNPDKNCSTLFEVFPPLAVASPLLACTILRALWFVRHCWRRLIFWRGVRLRVGRSLRRTWFVVWIIRRRKELWKFPLLVSFKICISSLRIGMLHLEIREWFVTLWENNWPWWESC